MNSMNLPHTTIEEKLGTGAYGEVYRAYNQKLGIYQAIKFSTK
jgi:serine/threonine protein kinase